VWSPLVLFTLQICTSGDHTSHQMMPQSSGLLRSPVPACCPSEAPPTTTSTLSMQDGWMDGMWTGNTFSLYSSCLATNHGGYQFATHPYVSIYLPSGHQVS
jgi:hypothetical protein